MTHADDASRLAKQIEMDDPASAGLIHAVLALVEANRTSGGWHELDEYDDLPEQVEQDYIFEYTDGDQVKWRLTAKNDWSMLEFIHPNDPSLHADPNDLADECVRWRWA